LLEALAAHNARMGILTRNSRENALATLDACGLGGFFSASAIIGRDCAIPKPSGDGIRQLLQRWGAEAADTVMVGDYLFDIQAGHDAGTGTVCFDPDGHFEHGEHADVTISRLAEITAAVEAPGDPTQ
jgi:phosphoglycolate phosphatase-like HAD superfamily hydrolase